MTSPNGYPRPITDALFEAHKDAVVTHGGKQFPLGLLKAFEAVMCDASVEGRNDLDDARHIANLLGPQLLAEFGYLVEAEE